VAYERVKPKSNAVTIKCLLIYAVSTVQGMYAEVGLFIIILRLREKNIPIIFPTLFAFGV
jgi:hypothetical protein